MSRLLVPCTSCFISSVELISASLGIQQLSTLLWRRTKNFHRFIRLHHCDLQHRRQHDWSAFRHATTSATAAIYPPHTKHWYKIIESINIRSWSFRILPWMKKEPSSCTGRFLSCFESLYQSLTLTFWDAHASKRPWYLHKTHFEAASAAWYWSAPYYPFHWLPRSERGLEHCEALCQDWPSCPFESRLAAASVPLFHRPMLTLHPGSSAWILQCRQIVFIYFNFVHVISSRTVIHFIYFLSGSVR